jgi:hypothetical protein
MGCTHWTRQRESEVTSNKTDKNGFRGLFYATNEFDLSRSESEDEDEHFSLNSIKNNKQKQQQQQQQVENEVVTTSNGLDSTNTTVNSVFDNRLVKTDV